jgi:cytochrome c
MNFKTLIPALALGLMPLLSTSAHANDDDMYKSKNCFACHKIERNTLGPAFKAIAAKYANDPQAEVYLSKKIREGGVGVWGQVPMPAQAQVNEAESVTLARWILKQQ